MLFGHLTFVWTQDIKLCFYISVLTTPCSGISQFPDAKKEKRKNHKATTMSSAGIRNLGMRGNLCRKTHTHYSFFNLPNGFFGFHIHSSIAPFPFQYPFPPIQTGLCLLTRKAVFVPVHKKPPARCSPTWHKQAARCLKEHGWQQDHICIYCQLLHSSG